MSESICNGCNKHFSERALDRHLRKPDQGGPSSTWNDVDSDIMPDDFGGDYFGTNYTPEDFQMSTESDDEASAGDAAK
ncbi:uncharacterized protein ARMOST_19103 [Armillaria ostoyae]|uniref:Uncharacterized protein n=1 Tax=Armillaria ostoyae TaxID=47428 RepID=A0A284S3L3_ARMOS|nr:uncharacterized protein ARMOST_19103 [Armillaria ostoyae]